MIIVIDSNEYIDCINKKTDITEILSNKGLIICVHNIIIKEVLDNLIESAKKEFYKLLFNNNIFVNDGILPLYLFEKYKKLGLKKGDIIIAAFCEYVEADYLITENRHFLKIKNFDRFNILNIKDFLTKIKE